MACKKSLKGLLFVSISKPCPVTVVEDELVGGGDVDETNSL